MVEFAFKKTTIRGSLVYTVKGTIAVGADVAHPFDPSGKFKITEIKAEVKGAPTGADIIIDVNKGGVSLFTTQANRPKVLAGATEGIATVPDIVDLVKDDDITIDVDQVGSTDPGIDLTLIIRGIQK